MTNQDFSGFQATVDGTAVSYENQADGTTVVTCSDGAQILVDANGDSRELPR